MNLILDLQNPYDYESLPTKEQFELWVKTALQNKDNTLELTIRIVDEDEIQTLNSSYRNKNKPTNVLSFPANLPETVSLDTPFLGDIVICAPIIISEAKSQNKALEAHWAHITIHSVLHLQGFDHISAEDANVMEPLEISLLASIGYPDPYNTVGWDEYDH